MRAALFLLVIVCLRRLTCAHALATTPPISVAQVHHQYRNLPVGKHASERAWVTVVLEEIQPISPRLTFLRTNDNNNETIELLLRERDAFLTVDEIRSITEAVDQPGATLHCCGFPERLSAFDGPTFFPHVHPPPSQPICLHVVAATVTLANGAVLPIRPTERRPLPGTAVPGRMPPLHKPSGNRGGGGNRDRGGIFTAWAMETFGLDTNNATILDVAGGSGQLAFQLGVRRGFNVTVVDPRELRLSLDQQRTLEYHRRTGLRKLPGRGNPSLPLSDYGHHFLEKTTQQQSDRAFWVSGQAQVRHLQMYFDPDFCSSRAAWRDCSVVLGMHPDEATEDLVDLALKDDKPFAVVPCCVFWKRDPQRRTPGGKQVRTWEQFCEYLIAKDEQRIQKATLPFPGRNVVLYSVGSKLRV